MTPDPHSVGEILDRLVQTASQSDQVTIGMIVEAFGHRSYGALLIVPGLIELSPVGAVPGVPTFLAVIVVIFAGQILVGRSHLWLPAFIARRSIGSSRLRRAAERSRPIGARLDRWFHGRFRVLTRGSFLRLAAALCILLALSVPPLEFLPFASSAPMTTIAMFGMAMLVRDGALMITAMLFPFALVILGIGIFQTVAD